jgi:hypothetical protein
VWLMLTALGVVWAMAKAAATEKSDDPVLQPILQERRLSKILESSKKRRLTRTEAADGLVLARRLGKNELARRFEKEVQVSRTRRPTSNPGKIDGSEKL